MPTKNTSAAPLSSSRWSYFPYSIRPLVNLLCVVGVLAVAGIAIAFQHVNWLYPIVFLATTSWYAIAAHRLIVRGAKGVDAIVVSEQIIACGIASLIGLVVFAVARTGGLLAKADLMSETQIYAVANVFAEGLLCAAIAPVIAMILRFTEPPADEAKQALDTLEGAAHALGDFALKSATISRSMERLSNAMEQSVHAYDEATRGVVASLQRLEQDIGSQSRSVGVQLTELDAHVKVLGDSMAKTTSELRRAAGDVSAVFTTTDNAIRTMGKSVDEFGRGLEMSSALLDGLRSLIASVDRFVRPNAEEITTTKET